MYVGVGDGDEENVVWWVAGGWLNQMSQQSLLVPGTRYKIKWGGWGKEEGRGENQ
jgi:hypothetical protein